MDGLSPAIVGALINQVAIPELIRWLTQLHSEGRMVTEAEAVAKLNLDVDTGNAAGRAFLESHGGA